MTTPDNAAQPRVAEATGKRPSIFNRLYLGNGAFDIVGSRRRWYTVIALIFLVCLGSVLFRGFNLGIDFVGGTKIQMPATGVSKQITSDEVKSVFAESIGHEPSTVQVAGTGASQQVLIRSETLNVEQVTKVKTALADKLRPQGGVQAISDSAVSGSWGGEITTQAIIALIVFLVLVTIFLAGYFERWMAVSALVALIFDTTVTAGVYSIVGFEMTPGTIIGLLTILGFSLYDTVVVFDKVKENTRGILGLTRRTYAEASNLALNQTLMRSLNTSLIAVLPVLGLLVIGVGVLGVGTLKDLALVQMTGMIAGAFSSIFLATPLLVDLKLTEPRIRQQAERVASRRANQARKAAAGETGVESSDDEALSAELRKEAAYAAAAGVPARTGKGPESRKARPTGKSAGRPSGKKRR
ncbi:protein translocase subunit SecF [Allokutzneria sp. A3M-2-11 16]|uniref:protein translocase subunit SecF n=1 Tax=Allokutzneria sp. A3M-2-11 16 TaxID=2962043 RepID=UPI0020B66E0B|nr:protein translocase subunit SecF [Allokutzneria sp. A3M-2-11 16]MCP3801343.1 protein translocase subunit SecF [Allokutzneria sp. A3M-2-11 16]